VPRKRPLVDRRIAGLEKETRDAEDRLRRLYMLIETGVAELDGILKERIEALKLNRDRASAALERAREGARQRIEISPALIEQFGCTMREKLASGDNAFRKTYISAIVDRVEVDDDRVRIIGRKEVLEQAVRAILATGPGVRSFVPNWRTRQDSNL
jgi:site-specific DNA recombinase